MTISQITNRLRWLTAFCVVLLLATVPASAATYTWKGTNSTDWSTTNNWLSSLMGPTNGNYTHRLDVNNGTNNQLIYTAAQGTTLYGGSSPGVRGLVIGSGAGGSGTMTITGGSFITTNGASGDIIGNTDNNTGILNISGGSFTCNSSISLGLGGGTGRKSFLNVNSGTATVPTLAFNSGSATLNLNGGTLLANNMTAVVTVGMVATNNFNGGTLQARTNHTAFVPANFTRANVRDGGAIIDSAGFNVTIGAALQHSDITGDAVIDGGVTKNGNGTLTLNGTPTYTGPTRVTAGTLSERLPVNSIALTVAAGAKYSVGATNTVWPMDSAALTNSTLEFNYTSWPLNGYTNAVMFVTNLSLSGSVTCNIAGTGFPVTNLTLLSYSAKTGGGSFVLGTVPPGAVATLTDDGANLTLDITSASIQNLVWSTGDGLWQTNGGLNWNSGTATYLEYPSGVNDVVTFNDTASGTVTITNQVNPSGVTVDVSGSVYTFVGPGSIIGTNGITKFGSSTLTIINSNSFTGPVTISGGTLYVSNAFALGATNGSVTVNGPANTLELGVPSGDGITVAGKSVTIIGTGVGGARGALRGAATASGTNSWDGPVVVGSDLARIGTEDNGNLTVSGTITDNGANYGLILRPGTSGSVTISGTGNSYGFTRTFGDATTSFIRAGANNAFATNRLELGVGNLDLNGFNQSFAGINDLSGLGKIINNGALPSTLTIWTGTNSANAFGTGGDVLDGTSTLSVVKTGLGRQTFSGANVTYTGPTTISEGQMNFTSVNPLGTAITVASGATLGGEATTTNSLLFSANSTLSADPSTPGSFVADTVNATASPINILFTAAPPTNTDTLVLSAPNGITGSALNFQAVGVRGGSFYLTNGNTQLMFVPSAAPASLVWKGNSIVNPTFWDTITTTNWNNGVSPDLFYAGDNVAFDDTASTFNVAVQGGTVVPSSVVVSSVSNYTFTGVIGGTTTLFKSGVGTLTLANNNTYNGLTTITNGVISIGTSTALGSAAAGAVISGSGTLDLNTAAAFANTINLGAKVVTISGSGFGGQGTIVNNSSTASQINAVQQVMMAGAAAIGGGFRWDIRGTANALDMAGYELTKVGANYIALVGTAVSNPGNITISNGTLGLQLAASLNGSSSNTLTVHSGGVLEFYQSTVAPTWTLLMNSGSTLWGENGSGAQNDWAGPVTVAGAVTLQADGVLNVSGEISGAGSLTKTGNSIATLTASNSYAGDTTVNTGTLVVQQATLATNSTITIATNAVLTLNFAETNTVTGLVLNGVSQAPGVYNNASSAPYIAGTGSLRIEASAPAIPSTPTNLVFSAGGGNVTLNWPSNYVGWILQTQTNSRSIGLSSNWADVPDTHTNNSYSYPVSAANPAVFFRLARTNQP